MDELSRNAEYLLQDLEGMLREKYRHEQSDPSRAAALQVHIEKTYNKLIGEVGPADAKDLMDLARIEAQISE